MRHLVLTFFLTCLGIGSFGQTRSDLFFNKFSIKEVIFTVPPISSKQMGIDNYKIFLERYWRLQIPYQVLAMDKAEQYVIENEDAYLGSAVKQGSDAVQFRIFKGKTVARTATIVDLGAQFEGLDLTTAELVYALNMTQYIIETRKKIKNRFIKKGSAQLNGAALKDKTLLISEKSLSSKLSEKSIKDMYPYEFKIVSQDEIDVAIIKQDKSSLVLWGKCTGWVIYQPSNGAIVSFSESFESAKDIKAILKNAKML